MTEVSEQDTARTERSTGVQVLSRAAEMLRLLKDNAHGLTQSEIATHLGMARTTVHRILNALADENLVQLVAASSRYRLGSEIVLMAEAARGAIIGEVHPYLMRLSDKIHETVDLSVLDRGKMTFIDQVVAPQRLRAVSVVGAAFPLHCTANGKALLASMPRRDALRLLEVDLERATSNTITDIARLTEELDRIAADRVAFDREEHSEGICAIGMVIRNTPLGPSAISVPIPAQRFESKRDAIVEALRETARAIEDVMNS